MTVRSQYDEPNDTYQLGDDIDGAFVVFAQIDGATVRGTIATAEESAREAGGNSGAGGTTGGAAGQINADDFTDNGDGTYTRKSDGAQGRFTPTGFTPTA